MADIGLQIAKRVRELREAREMTQSELADEMKTSQSTVSKIESGRDSNLTIETLGKLSDALGVELRVLLVEAS